MSYVKGMIDSIHQRGFLPTVRFLLYELIFELRYRVDTIRIVEMDRLDIQSANKHLAEQSQSTNYYYFKKILCEAEIDFTSSVFVDFGSGKGRALLMAAEYPFRRVVGIEFSPLLVQISQKNIEKAKAKLRCQDIEVVLGDAATYKVPSDANTFFFFNPFKPPLLDKVLENIEVSLEEFPRKAIFIYVNPVHKDVFLKRGYLQTSEIKSKNSVEAGIFKRVQEGA